MPEAEVCAIGWLSTASQPITRRAPLRGVRRTVRAVSGRSSGNYEAIGRFFISDPPTDFMDSVFVFRQAHEVSGMADN